MVNTEKSIFFDKVTIIGVGLIGASFALSIRQNNLCKTITGFGRKEENLKRAKERGIIDEYTLDLKQACRNKDLVVLSTPVGVFGEIIKEIKDILKKGSIVIDVGSVKGANVYEIESVMPKGVFYIGSHPIAGSDKSGIDDAKPDLFKSALCIITPTENSDRESLRKIAMLWEHLGAKIQFMDPHKHDEVYAAISHLPHVVAYALVHTVEDIDPEFINFAGQGFKDTTRIAQSSPEMWKDIVIQNRANLLKFLDIFIKNIEKIKNRLESMDAEAIKKDFSRAREFRKRIS